MPTRVTRAQALAFRWHAHQLDRGPGIAAGPADCDLLDIGVQDTGPDGAAWALRVRGAPPGTPDDLALAWTLRGAPHCYRRADLPAVAVATAPLSATDAAKRIFDAAKPLKAAGIPTLDALRAVAGEMRDAVRRPTDKGAVSTELTARMSEPYLRFCKPCNATHLYEMPFRLAALHAGLELRAGTSPPVLERIRGWRPAPYARGGDQADPRFDVIRGYLRFFGPAQPKWAAEFIDAPVREVGRHWPQDSVEISLDGAPCSILAADLDALLGAPRDGSLQLLGPYDPYLQLRDRALLVPDAAKRKALWPVLGRPGAVAIGGEIVGLWRPRTSGRKLTVRLTPWETIRKPDRARIAALAHQLAEFRGLPDADVADA